MRTTVDSGHPQESRVALAGCSFILDIRAWFASLAERSHNPMEKFIHISVVTFMHAPTVQRPLVPGSRGSGAHRPNRRQLWGSRCSISAVNGVAQSQRHLFRQGGGPSVHGWSQPQQVGAQPWPRAAQSVCSFHARWPGYPPVSFPIKSCHKLSSQLAQHLASADAPSSRCICGIPAWHPALVGSGQVWSGLA